MVVPADMKVLHSCDTPACVNPAHLSVGTQLENIAQMDARGRRRSRTGRLDVHAQEILGLIADGHSQRLIARQFNTSQRTICRLKGRFA